MGRSTHLIDIRCGRHSSEVSVALRVGHLTHAFPNAGLHLHSISIVLSPESAMKRILIVEDNADLASGLKRNLEVEGHRASVAGTARAALEAASLEAPDLVVLDLGLPDRDGYHVLEELRSRGYQMPVLILSARGLETDKVKGFRLGADDYVTKPFGVVELMARIAAHLRRSSHGDAAQSNGSLPDDVLQSRYGLTERQVEVARLLAVGRSNAEIAEALGLSTFTARNHTEQVLFKLGASTRARVGAILRGQA
jgi:DNA-binding response OmpR family regulator